MCWIISNENAMTVNGKRRLQTIVAAIPNLLVLFALIGIGYWGHAYHWRIPKFSALVGAEPHAKPTGKSRDDHAPVPDQPAEKLAALPAGHAASFPPIHFPSPDALRKSGITIGQVEQRNMDEYVTVYGSVSYDETRLAQLSCRVSGIVWRVEKKLGDAVKKGDILAVIDSNEVGKAKAEFLEADVKSDLAVKTLERLTAARQAIPEQQLREAEAEVRMSKVRKFNAQQALINLGLPISLQDSTRLTDNELAERLHFLGLPSEIVQSLDRETASANLLPLLSPLDGLVIDREIVTGEVVDPGRAQFIVADLRRMWLILNVRKEDAAGLELGLPVFFSSSGLAGEVESKLSWIATESDKRTRSVQVRAEVENPLVASVDADGNRGQWLLRANMFGSGRIRIREKPDALVVPSSAVQWDGVRHLVFSPDDDGTTFRPLAVQVGVVRDGYTEIRRGVALGQPIVTNGSYLLKSELVGVEN
jgi:membrane fusion protein, heavy metal efflux system